MVDVAGYVRDYMDRVRDVLASIPTSQIAGAAAELEAARGRGAMIFFAGNGGSAATASHFANDLGVGSRELAPPFRALSLADSVPVVTATGNDHGYEMVFVHQLEVHARPGDVFVAISASGNSPNLVRAVEFARTLPMVTVALTAFDGGRLREESDHSIHVPTEIGEYGPAEDAHLILNHALALFFREAARTSSATRMNDDAE